MKNSRYYFILIHIEWSILYRTNIKTLDGPNKRKMFYVLWDFDSDKTPTTLFLLRFSCECFPFSSFLILSQCVLISALFFFLLSCFFYCLYISNKLHFNIVFRSFFSIRFCLVRFWISCEEKISLNIWAAVSSNFEFTLNCHCENYYSHHSFRRKDKGRKKL